MKADSRVSVVVPNYNGIAFVEACFQALLRDAPQSELIMVDNGSADGSRFLFSGFPDRFRGHVAGRQHPGKGDRRDQQEPFQSIHFHRRRQFCYKINKFKQDFTLRHEKKSHP